LLQQQRLAKVMSAGMPVERCEASVGPSTERLPLVVVTPKMTSTGSQCELEPANTLRELCLDAQGFAESYAQGILADPSFNLATARTVLVSRPNPKNYRPRASKSTASCGAGPDSSAAAATNPLAPPPLPPSMLSMLPMSLLSSMPPMPPSFGGPGGLDFLSLLRGPPLPPLGPGLGPSPFGPGLGLSHLALLMNSYQQMQHMPPHTGELDPSLSSLLFLSGFPGGLSGSSLPPLPPGVLAGGLSGTLSAPPAGGAPAAIPPHLMRRE